MLVIRRRNYRGMFVRLFSFFAIFKLLGMGLLTGGGVCGGSDTNMTVCEGFCMRGGKGGGNNAVGV